MKNFTVTQLIERMRTQFGSKDVSTIEGLLAIQVNLTDPDGVLYVEIKDGNLSIEPYEYIDRNAAITISMDNFVKLLDKKLDPVLAFTLGKLKVDGDTGKVLALTKLI